MSLPPNQVPNHPIGRALALCGLLLIAVGANAADGSSKEASRLTAKAESMLSDWKGDQKSLEAARALLDQAIELAPEYAEAYRQFARAHMRWTDDVDVQSRFELLKRAEQALDRAIALDPKFGNAFSLRGHLYHTQKRPEEAKAALAEAERLGADDPWLATTRADLLLDDGENEAALLQCRRARDEHTDFQRFVLQAERCMIRALLRLDRLDEAEQIYQAHAQRAGADGDDISRHAFFLLCHRNRAEDAIKVAGRALRRPDTHQSRLIYLASMYYDWARRQNSGSAKAAERAWKQLEQVPVDDPSAVMSAVCGEDETRLEVLRALRDTHRASLVEPMIAVMAAAERSPAVLQAAFVMPVRGGAMVQGESYLNSEQDYRDPRTLIVRFLPMAVAAFVKQHGQTPDEFFQGKTISIVGAAEKRRIELTADGLPTGKYYYQTQIKVSEPWQVKLFEPKPEIPNGGIL